MPTSGAPRPSTCPPPSVPWPQPLPDPHDAADLPAPVGPPRGLADLPAPVGPAPRGLGRSPCASRPDSRSGRSPSVGPTRGLADLPRQSARPAVGQSTGPGRSLARLGGPARAGRCLHTEPGGPTCSRSPPGSRRHPPVPAAWPTCPRPVLADLPVPVSADLA